SESRPLPDLSLDPPPQPSPSRGEGDFLTPTLPCKGGGDFLALFGLAQPLPLLVAPVMSRIDPPQSARSAAHNQRFSLGPVHVVLDALQHLAVGDPGGGEKDVIAA